MKKTLLTATVIAASLFQSNAQCVIAPSCTPGASTGYCATPSASTNLPNGTVGAAYSSNIQFSLGTAVGGIVTITGATITATSGLPAGLSTVYNPVNGAIAGGGNACLQISGTPSAGTAGTYSFSATFNVVTSLGPNPVTAVWYLTIDPSTVGINTIANPFIGALVLSPNPAKSELNVITDLSIAKLVVIDAIGKVVISQDVNYANQVTLDIRSLERGIYFLQANDGSKVITKKFIKD